MSKKLFIIGKRSNLSCQLAEIMKGSKLISGDELGQLPGLLMQAGRSDLVYNLNYKSAWLGRRDAPEDYARCSFQRLSEFTAICQSAEKYIDKVIFTSSSAVYGGNSLASESDRCDITNLYAGLKFASELFLREHFAETRIQLITTRLFNMYGGDDEFSVISKIADAISMGREFQVSNHGRSVRDFVHIRDVVEIYQRLLASSFSGVVNVGSGAGMSVNDLIEKAETAFKRTLQISYVERNEINYSVSCIDTLLAVIGPIKFDSIDRYFQEKRIANIRGDLI